MLESIKQPSDLRSLGDDQLVELAAEIRDFLVRAVAARGGHLGPNLGVVELTIALHRALDSPVDRIVWDTGHQAYVHKLLTGRPGALGNLRTPPARPAPRENPPGRVRDPPPLARPRLPPRPARARPRRKGPGPGGGGGRR